jgi:hypothetical protein
VAVPLPLKPLIELICNADDAINLFRFNLCKSKAPLDASSIFANVPLTSCDWLPTTFIDPSGLGAKLNVSNIGVSGNGFNSISADLTGV